MVAHRGLLTALGLSPRPFTAIEIWRHLAETVLPDVAGLDAQLARPLARILADGPLARRLLDACGGSVDRQSLSRLQARLAECLRGGTPFVSATH